MRSSQPTDAFEHELESQEGLVTRFDDDPFLVAAKEVVTENTERGAAW